jgi:hypothetical protein
VHFASGSTKISSEDQAALKKLAEDAVKQTGYMHSSEGLCRLERNFEPEVKNSPDFPI